MTQTTTYTAEQIEKLEAAGFKRWQKPGIDRLYINAYALGLHTSKYGTGNIKDAEIDGSWISNSEARRMLAAKTYIDLVHGCIVSDNSTLEELARKLADATIAA